MSGFFRVQVTIPTDTGLPEDAVTNTLYFDSDQTFAEDADDVAARVATFYTALDHEIFSPHIGSPAVIRVYDMADPEPRVPGVTIEQALTPPVGATAMAPEVAICLSFRGALASGANMRRRRGRIYLGPLAQGVGVDVAGRRGISSSMRTTIINAAVAMATGPDPGDGRLAVFSITEALHGRDPKDVDVFTSEELAAAYEDVVEFWVDDAFDTQRRRGAPATTRTTGSV